MITKYFRSIRQDNISIGDEIKRGTWLHCVNPEKTELEELAEQFNLDISALRDALDLHESPRIEHEDGTVYLYVRYCLPIEGAETSTQPLLIILTSNQLITLARREVDPIDGLVRAGGIVTTQKLKLILQILTAINKGYRIYLGQVTKQVFASRSRLQRRIVSDADIIRFIDTEEDLNEILAALQPYGILLKALASGRYFNFHADDLDLIEDLELSSSELIELSKSRLKTIQNMRNAHSIIAANNLNRIFKRLTSIAIFLSIPTIAGGLYGMNVALPLEDNPYAFWIILAITTVVVASFVRVFSKKNWT
ncbi:magnesium transporter CorA family protein [soil metagenome]